jgi:hypothetical protein
MRCEVAGDLTGGEVQPIVDEGGIVTLSSAGGGSMSEMAQPFIRTWKWVEDVGGFPGQVFFCVAVVMLIIGALTWFANHRK